LFEAHKSPIFALSFSPNGEMLTTFSPKEKNCKIFAIDSSGVLNLLGFASRSVKSFNIKNADSNLNINTNLKTVNINWTNNKIFEIKVPEHKFEFKL
jgi:WD40 repeat protein